MTYSDWSKIPFEQVKKMIDAQLKMDKNTKITKDFKSLMSNLAVLCPGLGSINLLRGNPEGTPPLKALVAARC
jgi:hypothetical protein